MHVAGYVFDEMPPGREEKKNKRVASTHLEAQAPKKGKGTPVVTLRGMLIVVRNVTPVLGPRPHRK